MSACPDVGVLCQTVGWTKMPPCLTQCAQQTVLDGDRSLPPTRGHSNLFFGPCVLWPNRCMDQDATWYGCRPLPRPRDVRWDLAPPNKGAQQFPFRPMPIVAMQTAGRRYTRRCVRLPLHGKWHSSHSTFRPTLLWHGCTLLLNICSNIPLSFNDAVHS